MATKKKKKTVTKKKPAKRVFQDCGGGGCGIDRRALRVSNVATFPGFNYTTPSAINPEGPIKPRTRTQRKAAGCVFKTITYKGKGGVMKSKEVVADPRPECQDPGTPCSTERKTCPVQLFFREGEAFLRFCRSKGKAGFVKRVGDARQAQRLAAKACQCWEKHKSFDKCKDVVGTQLGGVKKRRRR